MTPADLDRIEKYCEAATPGPWQIPVANVFLVIAPEAKLGIVDSPPEHFYFGKDDLAPKTEEDFSKVASNSRFIASSRLDLPACVAEIKRLRAALESIATMPDAIIKGAVISGVEACRVVARKALGEERHAD